MALCLAKTGEVSDAKLQVIYRKYGLNGQVSVTDFRCVAITDWLAHRHNG